MVTCPSHWPRVPLTTAGCIFFKEGRYEQARQQFAEASKMLGYKPELLYNTALCHYKQKQYGPALKALAEVIERGVREHPELSVGSATEGLDVRSVGNSQVGLAGSLLGAQELRHVTQEASDVHAAVGLPAAAFGAHGSKLSSVISCHF
jgi:hypothetical protein